MTCSKTMMAPATPDITGAVQPRRVVRQSVQHQRRLIGLQVCQRRQRKPAWHHVHSFEDFLVGVAMRHLYFEHQSMPSNRI